jgi:hypothetical protein
LLGLAAKQSREMLGDALDDEAKMTKMMMILLLLKMDVLESAFDGRDAGATLSLSLLDPTVSSLSVLKRALGKHGVAWQSVCLGGGLDLPVTCCSSKQSHLLSL